MENASKALIMAGGILISLVIISLLVVVFNMISSYNDKKDEKLALEQIAEFNKQYESYNQKALRGADILSVCNKAVDYNKRESEEKGYAKLEITVELAKDGQGSFFGMLKTAADITSYKLDHTEFTNAYSVLQNKGEIDLMRQMKNSYYECINVEYDNQTNRIKKMDFKQRLIK